MRCGETVAFADESFDAVFSNDVLCHVPGDPRFSPEIYRVLKTGVGRMLFSDALIIGGVVSQDGIAARSSIGYYLFSPPGENERLMLTAGFTGLKVVDTTGHAALIAARWHHALAIITRNGSSRVEGQPTWAGLQRFLSCVQSADRTAAAAQVALSGAEGVTGPDQCSKSSIT